MDISKALAQQGITQRELGRRLGYDSNGVISGVLKKRISVPMNDIPKWADALKLEGADRDAFIDYYAEIAIPKWYRDRLAQAELAVAELRSKRARPKVVARASPTSGPKKIRRP